MHFTRLILSVILLQTSVSCWAQETKSGSTSERANTAASESEAALRQMHEHLIAANDLEFTTQFSIVNKTLGRNQSGTVHYILRKPNQLRVTAKLGNERIVVVSDGETLSIDESHKRKYRQVPADDTILGSLYRSAGLAGVQVRMIDFFWSVDYLADIGGAAWLKKLSPQTLGSKTCDGFNIQNSDDNWSVWLERSDNRLPCRLISKKKDGDALTTQTNTFNWKANPTITADTFKFVAPKGHTKVELGESPQ